MEVHNPPLRVHFPVPQILLDQIYGYKCFGILTYTLSKHTFRVSYIKHSNITTLSRATIYFHHVSESALHLSLSAAHNTHTPHVCHDKLHSIDQLYNIMFLLAILRNIIFSELQQDSRDYEKIQE